MARFSPSPVVLLQLGLLACLLLSGCSKSSNPTSTPAPAAELSANLTNGQTYAHRFFSAGNFPYHCSIQDRKSVV